MNNNKNDFNDKVLDFIIGEAVEKYSQDIANDDISCDMSDEEIKVMEEHKKPIYKKIMKEIGRDSKSHRGFSFKKCIVLVASLVVVFALSLNVSAFRVFLFKTYTDMTGTILNVETFNIGEKEYDVIEKFECKDEIIIPGWLPPGMELKEITDDVSFVNLDYHNKDVWLSICHKSISDDGGKTSIQTDKNVFSVDDCEIMDMSSKIVEIRSESGISMYTVFWNSDEVQYELSTNISRRTLNAVLASLKFYK